MANPDFAKDKDKRLEEAEKLRAEVARSLQVAEMKRAHKEIEDLEKQRKRATVVSICTRITDHAHSVLDTAKTINDFLKTDKTYDLKQSEYELQCVNKMYASVCYDFQKNLEIREEDYQKLFPNMQIKLEGGLDGPDTVQSLIEMANQLIHMRTYCDRSL